MTPLESVKPYSITTNASMYFCTDVISGWQYVFTSHEFFTIIIESLKYCQKEKGLNIHGYVVMPNHVHTILSALNNNLSDIMRDYKRHTSKKILEILEAEGNNKLRKYFSAVAQMAGKGNSSKVWQTGSHPISIESDIFFQQKINYIHENPVRKGYVERPEHWLYSSARNYYIDDHSIIKIDMIE